MELEETGSLAVFGGQKPWQRVSFCFGLFASVRLVGWWVVFFGAVATSFWLVCQRKVLFGKDLFVGVCLKLLLNGEFKE